MASVPDGERRWLLNVTSLQKAVAENAARSRLSKFSFERTSCITLRSGLQLDPYSRASIHEWLPRIKLADIAHSLSLQCRFMGHVDRFFSVASHSLLVMRITGELVQRDGAAESPEQLVDFWRQALLHDAHEALVGDVPSPLKDALSVYRSEPFRAVEDRLQRAVFQRWNTTPELSVYVQQADAVALWWEWKLLRPSLPPLLQTGDSDVFVDVINDFFPLMHRDEPERAKERFLGCCEELGLDVF